jgi:sec-independent protein translocase protein TatC
MMPEDEKKPFMSHLEELRSRLIVCAVAVAAAFFITYFFSERLFRILVAPLIKVMPEGEKLVFTSLPEMFMVYLKVALIAAVLLAAPVIFYEMWLFVAPGLYQKEKRFMIPFVVTSSILFVGGALFGYFIVFPFGFQFFIGYNNELVKALPSVGQYFSFSIKLLFAFGIIFELPVVIFFLTRMGLVTPEYLAKKRKYAILFAFIIGAILTPPDVFTQFLMAVPLIVLFELGIIVSKLARKKAKD